MRRTPVAILAGILITGVYALVMYTAAFVWFDNTNYEYSGTGLALISLGFGIPMWFYIRPGYDTAFYCAD